VKNSLKEWCVKVTNEKYTRFKIFSRLECHNIGLEFVLEKLKNGFPMTRETI
jgi:hypothetical protein